VPGLMHNHRTVLSRDLNQEARWPRWTQRVRADLGIQAMMSQWLYVDDRSYGALNLYADRIDAFQSAADWAVADVLATQISIALATQREIKQRGTAMTNRTVIGQAQGILIERLGMDADQAFAYLRQISQTEHRKLITICDEIVETRRLPQ
jgi:ANTAR domain/GAF domain